MVKWTPELDRLLLVKILAIHGKELSVDYEKIAASWPENAGEKPTKRAIGERIFKIKRMTQDRSNAGETPTEDYNAPGKRCRAAKGKYKPVSAMAGTKRKHAEGPTKPEPESDNDADELAQDFKDPAQSLGSSHKKLRTVGDFVGGRDITPGYGLDEVIA